MEDRVARILPSLMQESGRRTSLVVDEPVVIGITPVLDPLERALDVRPQTFDELAIRGVAVIGSGQHYEQRGRVHAAVITRERDLAERGHLTAACLVQDLSGLCVALSINFGRLRGRQEAQDARAKLRLDP